MKQSINIMLQKLIKPLKVPVPFTLSHSWTSQRSMIWSWVNTRTRTNKPWNWSTGCCVNSLFSEILQGHQLKPHEQHWFQLDKTWVCSPVPDQGLVLWGSTDKTTNYHSWKHKGRCLVPYWENTQSSTEGESWLVAHCQSLTWQTMEPPIFIYTDTRACCSMVLWTLFGISCLIGTAPVCVPDISFS